ncbi:IPT/TIG domain-containing protein [Tieghemostelium lacteum]|uniref:IPT/TIG domain-containing protein n=1 Tax=Tieghemostelium lacteum TaxID=361077 RepID=A0A151Z8U4_TIELA|nr:IPT/TIG domain-containing protein [Tieghemostelium lacteum]|eukprot:KYQ90366.1 IPT/TIG domain-containing protein [Tieghemostelium lacteum]
MLKLYILFLFLYQSYFLVFSEIINVYPDPNNSKTKLSFTIGYDQNIPIINNLTGDYSKEIYFPTCNNENNVLFCTINLNNISQSEKYTINYGETKRYTTSLPFQLKNKFLLDISKPNISESPILHFNGLYFQPYPIYFPLLIKISNLGVSQLFTLTDNSSFTDSTHFQIPLNDSVGEINVEINQGQFTNSYITHYSEPIINTIKCDYIKCTINGYNFGNSKFKNLTKIIFDSTTIQFNNSNNIPIQYNNTQIQFNHNNNFSKESSFSISVSSISSINPFNYTFRPIITSISTIPFSGGEITINGYFLNSKRENGDNSTISIQIGSFTCQNPSNIIENDFTSIKCLMNGNDGSNSENLPISIEIDGVENEMTSIKFTFNLPTITSIQHDIIDFNNDSLIINGFNFNNFDGTINPIIHFNNQSKSISNTNNNNNKTSISIQLLHFFDNNQTLKNGNIQIQTSNQQNFKSDSTSIETIHFKN